MKIGLLAAQPCSLPQLKTQGMCAWGAFVARAHQQKDECSDARM